MDHRGGDNKGNNGKRSFGAPANRGGKPFHRDGNRPGGGFKRDGEKREFRRDGDFKRPDGEKRSFNRDGQKRDGFKKDFKRPGGNFQRGGFNRKPAPQKPYEPGARDVALKALRSVARDSAYAAQALDRELNAVKLSNEDRRLAASIFYFTLENRLRIEHCIASKVKQRPEPEIMDILSIAVAQLLFMDKIPDHAAVDEAVEQTRRAKKENSTALVNAILRGLIRDRDAGELQLPDREAEPEKYISEKHSVALPLVERLVAAYGVDEAEAIAAWSPDRRADTIRPNRLLMNESDFEAWLDKHEFKWEKGAVPGAYRVREAGRLASHEGYRSGVFSIQGESSMLAALAVSPKAGMQVLDACAAPGGKSCLMAEMMRGAGRVYSWDLHDHRVELIRAAARRLNLENIRPQQHDASRKNENLYGMMDAVLVDAPCSGLGVMGDKPDIKYRLTADTIEALVPIQQSILEACSSYVRPGGLLVYSTCTILPEENEMQVKAFLEKHPEFEPAKEEAWLPEAFRADYADGMLQLLPSRHGVDGFFIARLRRKAV